MENGVEFFDIESRNPHIHIQTPQPQHFRSSSLGDVDVYLLSKWEQCLDEMVQLQARISLINSPTYSPFSRGRSHIMKLYRLQVNEKYFDLKEGI